MKKIFMTLAAVALVLASCSKEEVTQVNTQNPDAIKFTSATSRAAIADITTLTGDSKGFKVYATSGSSFTGWYNDGTNSIDGTNNYIYGSGWAWDNSPVKWPTTSEGYTMNFYALHPDPAEVTGTGVTLTANVASNTATITGAVVINDVANQLDLLAAKNSTGTKPSDATLPLTFDHILSKVNFGIIAGNGATVTVQSLSMKNAANTRTYDYVAGAWNGTTATGSASYDYWPLASGTKAFTGTDADEQDAEPFYTFTSPATSHTNHLMLMPQAGTTAWDKTSGTLATGAYIEVVYRITTSAGDYIGYTDATNYLVDYPGYNDGDDTWGTYNGIDIDGNSYGAKEFFIKVGFPLEITWTKGLGYTYNICLGTSGSTNGYYVEDTYIDEDGETTGVPIIGPDKDGDGDPDPVDEGDPVTSGNIDFRVSVSKWTDQTATPIQN